MLKRFRNFIRENHIGPIDLNNPESIGQINSDLSSVSADPFLTPYMGLEKVKQILARYSLHMAGVQRTLDGDVGNATFELLQFGGVMGKNIDGSDISSTNLPTNDKNVHYRWHKNTVGTYYCECEILDDDTLVDLVTAGGVKESRK
jgi:hypothetical protein